MLFDRKTAEAHLVELDRRMTEIEKLIEPQLPPRNIPKSRLKFPPKKQFNKDGTPSKLATKYFGSLYQHISGDWYFTPTDDPSDRVFLPHYEPLVTHEPMRLANTADIKEWLVEQGWKPIYWNYKKDSKGKYVRENGRLIKTTPKFTDLQRNLCPNLERLNGDLVRPIVDWLSYRNRRNVILSENGTGWISSLRDDNRIPTGADTLGTNTARFTHKGVANVPRVRSIFGREMRELFTTDLSKYFFIGWDASGLEARIEGHYTYRYDGGEYARELLDGDIHSRNSELFGCSRDIAKNGKYALSYGAQPPKLADTIGVSKQRGQELFDAFWERNWSLRDLRDNLTKFWKSVGQRKWILGLDGRKIVTRSEHSLINTLFQSAGIICMKEAMILADRWITEGGYDAYGLIRYHDEEAWEVSRSLVQFKSHRSEEEGKKWVKDMRNEFNQIWGSPQNLGKGWFTAYCIVGELGIKSIEQAGKNFNLNVPLTGEYKVGRSWADVH